MAHPSDDQIPTTGPRDPSLIASDINEILRAINQGWIGTSAPSNPVNGMAWIDTSGGTTWTEKRYDASNTQWIAVRTIKATASSPGSAPVISIDADCGGKRLKNVATPTANADAATKAYVDGASSGGSTYKDVKVYPGSVSTTWTKPTGLLYVEVWCIGGGGKGDNSGGSGGGGGAAYKLIYEADLGSTEEVVAGGDGSDSRFGADGSPHLTATGGSNSGGGSGGSGGSGSGGDINLSGGDGAPAQGGTAGARGGAAPGPYGGDGGKGGTGTAGDGKDYGGGGGGGNSGSTDGGVGVVVVIEYLSSAPA